MPRSPRLLAALIVAISLGFAAIGGANAGPAELRPAPAPGEARAPAAAGGAALPAASSAEAAALRAAAPELDLPVRYQHGRIVVRAQAGLDGRARATAARADAKLAEIAADLRGLPVPEIAEIRLVHDAADLPRAAPPGYGAPEWAAGVAYPSVGVVVVATYRGPSTIDVDGTVDHELAHLALGAALGDLAPRWLHEGFAYLHSTDWEAERAQTLAGMAWFGSVIPLDELERGFPRQEAPASRAYAQSYDFTSFLARRGRWPEATDDGDRFPFQYFLQQIAATGDVDAAAERAYGRPLGLLFEEWRVDLKNRYLFVPISVFLGLLWIFGAVLLVLGWRRRRRQMRARLAEWEQQEQAAQRAREQARDDGRLVPAVPIWSGPMWAPPGAPVTEAEDDDVDVDALLDEDDDRPRPPPPPRRPTGAPN